MFNLKTLAKKPVIKLLALTGWTLVKKPLFSLQKDRPIDSENFFDLYFSLKETRNIFFVQIGAHDGKFVDPLHQYIIKYNLKGIAVEPQLEVFEKLRETYSSYPNVECVNTLIGSRHMPFYVAKKEVRNNQNWNMMTGIASFNIDVIKKTIKKKIPRGENPEDYIDKVELPTISLSELFAKHSVKKIDFLQIDCEGYDYEILKMLDFNTFRPDIINLESMHFTNQTMKDCDKLLTDKGYQLFRTRDNTCAYKI